MNPYPEDLRKKIVEAIGRGMTKAEAARAFGVGLSSVKRYVAMVREGRPLVPKRRPGPRPKLDETAKKLLEADLEERPAATLSHRREFLERVAGVRVSDSTISRMLKRLGWSQKKIPMSDGARRVPEGRLAGSGDRDARWAALRVRG